MSKRKGWCRAPPPASAWWTRASQSPCRHTVVPKEPGAAAVTGHGSGKAAQENHTISQSCNYSPTPRRRGEEEVFVCLFVLKTPSAPARMGRKGRHASWWLWSETPLFPPVPWPSHVCTRTRPPLKTLTRGQWVVWDVGDRDGIQTQAGLTLGGLRVTLVNSLPLSESQFPHYKKRDCTTQSARVLPGPNMFRGLRIDRISGSGSGPACG